jgi:hypothetical protein
MPHDVELVAQTLQASKTPLGMATSKPSALAWLQTSWETSPAVSTTLTVASEPVARSKERTAEAAKGARMDECIVQSGSEQEKTTGTMK